MTDLRQITLDDTGLPDPSPEIEQERRVALFDLSEANSFQLIEGPAGPFDLALTPRNDRLHFHLTDPSGAAVADFSLPLDRLAQVSKDYATLCHTYTEAVRTLPPAGIAAIDEARRAIHDEGARALKADLAATVAVDDTTARRLFTLVSVLRSP